MTTRVSWGENAFLLLILSKFTATYCAHRRASNRRAAYLWPMLLQIAVGDRGRSVKQATLTTWEVTCRKPKSDPPS